VPGLEDRLGEDCQGGCGTGDDAVGEASPEAVTTESLPTADDARATRTATSRSASLGGVAWPSTLVRGQANGVPTRLRGEMSPLVGDGNGLRGHGGSATAGSPPGEESMSARSCERRRHKTGTPRGKHVLHTLCCSRVVASLRRRERWSCGQRHPEADSPPVTVDCTCGGSARSSAL